MMYFLVATRCTLSPTNSNLVPLFCLSGVSSGKHDNTFLECVLLYAWTCFFINWETIFLGLFLLYLL